MKELKNFKSTKKTTDKEQNQSKTKERLDEQDVKKIIDEHSSKSEEELMKELKEEVNKSKREGNFTDEQVQNFKKTVLPFLSDEQKSKLDEIINLIT